MNPLWHKLKICVFEISNHKVKLYVFKFLSIKLDISNLCFNFANRRREPLFRPYSLVKYNLSGMKDRIKKIMESNHMTQKIFSQFTGISEGSLSGVLNNKTRPTLQMVDAIHKHFPQVSLEWLLYGVGSMESGSATLDDDISEARPSGIPGDPSSSSPLLFDMSQQPTEPRYVGDPSGLPQNQVKYIDRPQRKITEIRIFYDDQTWETFTPKK